MTIILMLWWSLARGNHLVPSRWQATTGVRRCALPSRPRDSVQDAVACSERQPGRVQICGLKHVAGTWAAEH